jgi:hypothetical protein
LFDSHAYYFAHRSELGQGKSYKLIHSIQPLKAIVLADMLGFESLYKHLEKKATDYTYYEISALFQKIRDKMHVDGNTDLETKAQWEMDFFNFSIQRNVISPMWTMPDSEGNIISYPTYDNFTQDTYDFLINRLCSTYNSLLKARYAHILWFSPKKHGKYAVMSIDGYLELLKIFEEKEKQNTEHHIGHDLINAVENAFFLAKNINNEEKLKLIKSEIKRLIFNFNPKSGWLFRLRADFISLMIEEKTVFLAEDFNGIADLCLTFSKKLADSHQAITMLGLGEKVEQRIKTNNYNWKDLIAQSYEKLMRANLDKNKHVAIGFCQNAIENYKISKNNAKVDELEKIYNKLKGSVEFKEIKVKIDLSKYIADCQKKAIDISQKYSGEQIIEILMADKSLIPEYKTILDLTQELLKEHPLQTIFPITLTDEQGHTAQHFDSKEEMEFYRMLHQYRMSLENFNLPFVYLILKEAFAQKKLSYQILMDYFAKKSWFGKTFTRKIQNKDFPYNWLNLLAPSLYEYFCQMEFHYSSKKYPNLVLCMDSLSLKIEGLLRDLLLFSGVTTFYSTQDNKGRTIYREKDINSLLREEKVKDLFDPDDLLLFKFVLVEKAGYNLRHKIAHSLILREEYTIDFIHLLLLLLLRLAKFDVKPIEKPEKMSAST